MYWWEGLLQVATRIYSYKIVLDELIHLKNEYDIVAFSAFEKMYLYRKTNGLYLKLNVSALSIIISTRSRLK